MAMDEATRHRIHGQLEQLLGTEEAAAIMGALVSSDLDARMTLLEANLDHTRETVMAHTTATVADLGSTLRAEMNQLYRWTVGSIVASMSLGLAAGRLLTG
jgi:hypothetical protein